MRIANAVALIALQVMSVSPGAADPPAGPTLPTTTSTLPAAKATACAAKAKSMLADPRSKMDAAQLAANDQSIAAAPCVKLRDAVYAELEDRFQAQINARAAGAVKASDVLPKDNDSKGGQGSPAQSQAVPSVQPVSTAGGSVALAGLSNATALVSAVAINPATLFVDPDPTNVKQYARASRFGDISIVIPGNLSSTLPSGQISYIGVRARLNLTGIHEGDAAYKAVQNAYDEVRSAYDNYRRAVEPALVDASDVDACVNGIVNQNLEVMKASCGKVVLLPDTAAQGLSRELVAAAKKADSQYLGLDLRADFGDPRFSGDPMAGGTYLLAAAAAGKQIGNLGVRGRFGVAYTKLDKEKTASYAVDGGLALEAQGGDPQRLVRVSIGLEGRTGSADVLADQHFLDLHVGLSVPLADGKSISIGILKPLHSGAMGTNTHTTALTISGDLSLLSPRS